MKRRYKLILTLLSCVCLLCCNTTRKSSVNENRSILVIGKTLFSDYTSEILKAEGFNALDTGSLEILSSSDSMKKIDIVILPAVELTESQKEVIITYVKNGGNLIAFLPDEKLNAVFGLKNKEGLLSNPYISIDSSSPQGHGLIAQTLQVHGIVEKRSLAGGHAIASFYSDAFTATGFPAAVVNDYGAGHTIAFLYNLPENIALTRQGNYRFAGQEKDSIKGIRAMDMFTGGWVDTSKNTLNQADEQMRLLSHCIAFMSSYQKPIPRLWYFPDTLQCLVTLTNDGEFSEEKDFEPQFNDIELKDATMALYILETDKVSKTATDRWQRSGHEISGHPDATKEAEQPTWTGMNAAINTRLTELENRYNISGMSTIVNHWFVWCGNDTEGKPDFTAQAKIEASFGIGMDINYAHYDNNSNQPRFLGPTGLRQGNYTGSGLPLKFSAIDGSVINIYQHLNNIYDQQYMEHKDAEGFFQAFKGLVDRSIQNEVYSYVCIKAHNDEYSFSKTPLLQMLDYAKEHGIPVWTPVKLLKFLEARDEARFTEIKWTDGRRLSFKMKSALKHSNGLTCMIPYTFNGVRIHEITVNNTKQSFLIKKVKGFDYAFLTVGAGAVYNIEANYTE